jgi:PAS domain S-box-containing protein
MRWNIAAYVIPLFGAAAVALVIALYAWRRRSTVAALPVAWAMISVACWLLGYAFSLASSGIATKVFWTRVEYLGIVLAPLAGLTLALEYTGREEWLPRKKGWFLVILPIITLVMVWTNDLHHLFHERVYLDTTGRFPILTSDAGPWFWVHAAYSYLVLLAAILLLVYALVRAPRAYRGQPFVLVIGLSAPLAANAVYLADLGLCGALDPTPFVLTISGLVFAWGLFRYRLFDITPLARESVIEAMRDGVIVLDTQNRIIDINPAAIMMLGISSNDAPGRSIADVLSTSRDLSEQLNAGEAHTELVVGEPDARSYYDVSISSLRDGGGVARGILVVLHDVTRRKQADEALRDAEDRFKTIFENAAIGLYRTTPDGQILMANPAMIRMLGFDSFEELSQRNLEEAGFEPTYSREEFKQRIEREGQVIGLESPWRIVDGSLRFIRENARAIRGADGEVQFYEGSIEDITERKRVENELRERERFLAVLNDITHAALETLDIQTMLQRLADRLGDVIGADSCYINLWDQASGAPVPVAVHGAGADAYASIQLEPGEATITAAVLASESPLVIDDVYDSPYLSQRLANHFPDRSVLGLPLIAGDQKFGAAVIAFNQPHTFTANEIARVQQATGQIALAIAQAKLLEGMHSQWREAETLRGAASAVTETLSLHETLERILTQLEEVLPYDSASIQLMRDGCVEIVDGRGFAERESVIGISFPVPGDNPNSAVVSQRQPLILDDAPAAHPPFRDDPHGHIRSWLGVPLIHHDQLIGVLAVDSKQPHHFTDEHIRLVTPFASQAAIAIENARLYEESQRLVQELTALYEAALATSSALESDMLLNRLHAQVHHLMAPDTVLVALTDEAENEVQIALAVEEGETLSDLVGTSVPMDQAGLTAWVIREREPLLVRDMEHDDLPTRPQHGSRPAHSWLGVPLLARDRLIGVISVQSFRANAFTEADRRFLTLLAGQTAIALENARLVEALRRYTRELEDRNEELDAFAHTVAHDLQNPLGVIIGFSETLLIEYATMSRERLGQYLRLLARNGRTMSNIIDELLLLAGVRKMEVEMVELDMTDIVSEAQARLAYLADERQAEIVVPDVWPSALGYAPWLEEVWVNYISNAIKYGGWPPRVELGATQEPDGMVRFWVRDNGSGLTQQEQQRLFTPFTRLDQYRAKGHGLGLSIVLRIVERLGGEVGVDSQPGHGSVFWFSLPRHHPSQKKARNDPEPAGAGS